MLVLVSGAVMLQLAKIVADMVAFYLLFDGRYSDYLRTKRKEVATLEHERAEVAEAATLALVALNALAMVAQHYVSLSVLARMSPVSHSLVNLFKRVVVIGASVAVFRNPVSPLNALGMLLASAGVACYSHASRAAPRRARADDEAALLESGEDAGGAAV